MKLIEPWMIQCIQLFSFFEKGLLPFSGGIFEQPNIIFEVFLILKAEVSKFEEEQVKKNLTRKK